MANTKADPGPPASDAPPGWPAVARRPTRYRVARPQPAPSVGKRPAGGGLGAPRPAGGVVPAIVARHTWRQPSRPGRAPGAIPRVPLVRNPVAGTQREWIPRRSVGGGCDDSQEDQGFG